MVFSGSACRRCLWRGSTQLLLCTHKKLCHLQPDEGRGQSASQLTSCSVPKGVLNPINEQARASCSGNWKLPLRRLATTGRVDLASQRSVRSFAAAAAAADGSPPGAGWCRRSQARTQSARHSSMRVRSSLSCGGQAANACMRRHFSFNAQQRWVFEVHWVQDLKP